MSSDRTPATAVEINETLVRKLIAVQFPQWAHLSVSAVERDGWDNRTFRLGEALSVRLPSAACYNGQVKKERQWLPKLAPHLPLRIPAPIVMGSPADDYPWHWSVNRWIDGDVATVDSIDDLNEFARTLAGFLAALHQIESTGGPPPGPHNFYRGGSLATYDAATRRAVDSLGHEIDKGAITTAWEAGLQSSWKGPPVWVHGDVAASNLLVKDGRLTAVIDFGCMAAGDPACDLTIAWTLFSGESRQAFRATIPLDNATWARARGWALWKALITLAEHRNTNSSNADEARRVIDHVLSEAA